MRKNKNIISNIISSICVIIIFFLAVACSSSKVLNESTERTVTVKELIRDTIIKIEPDSSYYAALLRCTEDGKVMIDAQLSKSGKRIEAPNVIIKDNHLLVDCNQKADSLFFQWKEKYIQEHQTQTITKTVYVEQPLTLWQKIQLYTGKIVLAIATLLLIWWLYKSYKMKTKL